MENADKIVVINEGRVEQIGTHNDLIARDGLYKQLVQRQMTGKLCQGDDILPLKTYVSSPQILLLPFIDTYCMLFPAQNLRVLLQFLSFFYIEKC